MKGSDLFPVEDSAFEEILKIFGTDEETFNQDVKKLKEWMTTQPHLPEIIDEAKIRNFLLLNKCSIEQSKKKIDMYYTIRSLIPDMFENINPKLPNMKRVAEIIYCVPLPKLTKDMYRVTIFKMRNKDMIDQLEPVDIAAYIFNMFEIRMSEDYVLGDVLISDMKGLNLAFFMKLSPVFFIKVLAIYEKVYSIRMKNIFIINSHPFLYKLLTMLKTILKPKMFERKHILENPTDLFKYFDKEMLPKEYGGKEKCCEDIHELIQKKFEEYKERFDKLDHLRVYENLRPEVLKDDEFLGFHGSFKQLTVD